MEILIICYILFYSIPAIILDLLQINYIKIKSKEQAVILNEEDYKLSAMYGMRKRRIDIVDKILGLIIVILWLSFGINFLYNCLQSIEMSIMMKEWTFVMAFFIIGGILSIPMSFMQRKLDQEFGFCKTTTSLLIIDIIKSSVLFLIFGGGIIFILLAFMDSTSNWWLFGFIFSISLIILVNLIYPTLIAPIFNKFTPLEDEKLKECINQLISKVGFKSSGIFVMDASKRDGRLNAYFGGIGKSKRVVLFDTLLDKISENGLMAILGHELGHFKNNDLIKNILLTSVLLFSMFAIAGLVLSPIFNPDQISNGIILVLLILISPLFFFIFMPIIGYFSRKAEYNADKFGAECVDKKALKEALIRLVNENKSFPHSHPAFIFFYYTHPPLIERLKALE